MTLDPRTPVLVGAAAINQRADDPTELSEPLDLMAEALEAAAEDAGSKALLSGVDCIWSTRGFWSYSDPGRLLAARFGAASVRTVIAEIGILQTTVLGRAAQSIAEGRSEIAMIVGAEARDRSSRLQRQGLDVPLTVQEDEPPAEVLQPSAEIMGQLEIDLGLITPTIQYSLIDNAIRGNEGQSIADHRAELGALWGDFNRVAVANPDAWNREALSPEAIAFESASNRMLSFPYTKSLVSQWNVNQSAGLILCSLEKAQSLGLDSKRFIYPMAVIDSEHMVTLSERRDLHRSPGFQLAGERALAQVRRTASDIEHLELYSCFPAAVRIQQREFCIDPSRTVTQTGGMTFGGGPLNNFVLQSWAKMVEVLRADPGSTGLVTAISGLITKQGVSILGPEPTTAFRHEAVTAEAAKAQATVVVDSSATGRARVVSYTVSMGRDVAQGLILFCDFEDGRRALRVVTDSDLAAEAMQKEFCGREVDLGVDGAVRFR